MMKKNNQVEIPTISVVLLCFNQKKFIRQSLKSILSQYRDGFRLQLIVADDCSTDGTQEIIKSILTDQIPDIDIKLLFRSSNQGVQKNLIDALVQCDGIYIAICEGDDYWTDNSKLVKQFKYMQANRTVSVCFHPVEVRTEGKTDITVYPHETTVPKYDLTNLVSRNFIQTNSVMYKNIGNYHTYLKQDILPLDWFLHILHAQFGRIGFLGEVMAVYRRNSNGVWWQTKRNRVEFWKRNAIKHINMFEEVNSLISNHRLKQKIDHQLYVLIDTIFKDVPSNQHSYFVNLLYADSNISYLKYLQYANLRYEKMTRLLEEKNHELSAVSDKSSYHERENARLINSLDMIRESLSWKVTAPLRKIKKILK